MKRARPPAALLVLLLLAGALDACHPASPEATTAVHRRAWLIMGTACEITLYAADSTTASRAFDAAWRSLARVDTLMSLYRPDSEFSRMNREGAAGPVPVSRETAAVIAASLDASRKSDGAFDITVKPLMDLWGFYRRTERIPPESGIDSARALTGWRGVSLDTAAGTVTLARAGMGLDPGGIAKGYAVDLAVEALRRHGIRSALVNLGGNIAALGAPPDAPAGWPVGIRRPEDPDSLFGVITLRDAAVASSAGYERSVLLEGRRFGHIIDPRRGRPVEATAVATALAPTAMLADALSTTFYVLGPGGTAARLAAWPEVEALVLGAETAAPATRRVLATGRFAALADSFVTKQPAGLPAD